MQRRRLVVTEELPIAYNGKYRIGVPQAFRSATGHKIIQVCSARVYNTATSQFDVSFTLHADFAEEASNRYDGFISTADQYFSPEEFSSKHFPIINSAQDFHIWFKYFGTNAAIDFSNYKFIVILRFFFD